MTGNRKRTRKVPDDPARAYSAALKTAMNIVSYKDNTERTLYRKLSERGYQADTVEAVVEFMRSKGYVDDGRMLLHTARNLALVKLYGKARIRNELSLKGFDRETLDSLDWSGEELCDIDFTEICLKLLKKRGGERNEKNYAYLRRYGHTSSDIKAAYTALNDVEKKD